MQHISSPGFLFYRRHLAFWQVLLPHRCQYVLLLAIAASAFTLALVLLLSVLLSHFHDIIPGPELTWQPNVRALSAIIQQHMDMDPFLCPWLQQHIISMFNFLQDKFSNFTCVLCSWTSVVWMHSIFEAMVRWRL